MDMRSRAACVRIPLCADDMQLSSAFGSRTAEHFYERSGYQLRGGGGDDSESSQQALSVHRTKLVENHLSGLSLEAHRYSRRVRPRDSCHGRNDYGLQMAVHLVRRYDQARPRLLYFGSMSGIQTYQPNLIPPWERVHQRHSLRSKAFASAPSNRTSS